MSIDKKNKEFTHNSRFLALLMAMTLASQGQGGVQGSHLFTNTLVRFVVGQLQKKVCFELNYQKSIK